MGTSWVRVRALAIVCASVCSLLEAGAAAQSDPDAGSSAPAAPDDAEASAASAEAAAAPSAADAAPAPAVQVITAQPTAPPQAAVAPAASCWPGQTIDARGACVGMPRCPSGHVTRTQTVGGVTQIGCHALDDERPPAVEGGGGEGASIAYLTGWFVLAGAYVGTLANGVLWLAELTCSDGVGGRRCAESGGLMLIPLVGPWIAIPLIDQIPGNNLVAQVTVGAFGVLQAGGLIAGIIGAVLYAEANAGSSARLRIDPTGVTVWF